MRRTPLWLVLLTLILIAFSVYALYPSFRLYTLSPDERQELTTSDPGAMVNLERRAVKTGLDLRGGMHVVLEVDKSKLNDKEKLDAVDRALEVIRNRVDQFGVAEPLIQKSGDDRIIVELPGVADPDRARELIGRTALLEFKLMPEPATQEDVIKAIDRAVAQALPDEMAALAGGTPLPEKESADSIARDLFADTSKGADTASAAAAADTTAKDGTQGDSLLAAQPFSLLMRSSGGYGFAVDETDVPTVKRYLDLPDVKAAIPRGVQLAWGTRESSERGTRVELLYILNERVELSGQYLTDARPSVNSESGGYQVNFELTREGGTRFHRITRANIGKPLVIVLDERVESAATIQSAIREQGRITLGGGATFEEAKDLSIVLRAGALPAPVIIAENNVVGPSLGRDSIRKGSYSALLGFILVFLFMAVYYKMSGLIADIALLFNLLFLMAAMAAMHATLTMPGIAGIILTMGMSVDSNVLIFERIREEMRTGKTIRAAIDAGYDRALLTIIDSHVTTLITAAVLFIFGTGPIKGFAVTLSLGVSISLFTALFITKAIFDARKQYQSLSI
jgi:preprotein translocase subunit SecD